MRLSDLARPASALALALACAACSGESDPANAAGTKSVAKPAAAPAKGPTAQAPTAQAPTPAAAPSDPVDPALQAKVDQINNADFAAPAAEPTTPAARSTKKGGKATPVKTAKTTTKASNTPDPLLIKAEVLLGRANFSPGVIDGLRGTNMRHAVAAFAKANNLESEGELTAEIWSKLNEGAPAPVAATYTLTEQDVTGPYYPDVSEDLFAASKLDKVGYIRPTEMLAERFHMSEDLLKSLNAGADFAKAGAVLVVTQPTETKLAAVDHIEVDKAAAAVRAYAKDDTLLATFPATVGASDRPSPSGVHKVNGVARQPTYTYDPSKLTWGPKEKGKFIVPAGPNNPVGAVWIDLNAPTYGLHGSPEPSEIGKTASHGCVRMTNWDVQTLAAAVKPGVVVSFINTRGDKKEKPKAG